MERGLLEDNGYLLPLAQRVTASRAIADPGPCPMGPRQARREGLSALFSYDAGGAIGTRSVLGPLLGAGLVQWISPLRAGPAFESVMLSLA
jgi:hypothetical protein